MTLYTTACQQTSFRDVYECKVALAGSNFAQCHKEDLENSRTVCELREGRDTYALRQVAVITGLKQVCELRSIPV